MSNDVRVAAAPSLDQRYRADDGAVQLTGVQTLVRLALDVRRADLLAGHDSALFISGYEGSPLGGYDLELGKHAALLEAHDIVFRPAVNEELAATAVQGTQLAATMTDKRVEGITGFWYGKSPGVDRAADALRHANLCGTHRAGGAVAFVGDDPTAKSSTVPGASELLLADLGIPTLYPANPQQVLDFGLHAVAMSRACGLWTAVKIVTNVADGSGTVDVDPHRLTRTMPSLEVDGAPFTHTVTAKLAGPTLLALERSRNGPRLELARRYAQLNGLNAIRGARDGARVGIIAAGKSFADVRQSLSMLGLDESELGRCGIRLLQLGMIYPLEPSIIAEFATGLDEIVVVEEKRPFIEAAVKDQLFGRPDAPVVVGKKAPDGTELFAAHGELGPDVIAAALAARIARHVHVPGVLAWRERRRSAHPARPLLPLAVRTPYFCSGCPHNSSTKAPDGALVGAGIGCHGLALLMTPELVGEIIGLDPDGRRGRAVDRHDALPSPVPICAEPRRRHLSPLGQPGRARSDRRRRQHHLQAALQLRGRHDRRPAGRGAADRRRARARADWPRVSRRSSSPPMTRHASAVGDAARSRGMAPRPADRSAGEAGHRPRGHGAHSRAGVRDRAAA